MEKKLVKPEQLFVPGEYEPSSDAILKIYFRIFEAGHGSILPPVLVLHKDVNGARVREWNDDPYFVRVCGALNNAIESKIDAGAEYFLLDGNHRAIAATLCHRPISVLELQVNEDVDKAQEMVESGELFDLPIIIKQHNLKELTEKFKEHLRSYFLEWVMSQLHNNLDLANNVPLTLMERVDSLALDGGKYLPRYMIEKYKTKSG